MVRYVVIFLIGAAPLMAEAKPPTVRAMLTFTPGYLTAAKTTTYGLGGELEIYTSGKVSMRSDGYALVGKSEQGGLKQNYQGFLGIVYNFDKLAGMSPFMGFQPGFGLAQMASPTYSDFRLMPVFSPFVGLHYFAETLFHFTLTFRYVYGELLYPTVGSVSMSEIRLSFGLGFHI
ncbi:MAG: hypothetical protein KF713_03840 [Turneriella sp.]|nr:hypothetical protein [Turneriella sp.]